MKNIHIGLLFIILFSLSYSSKADNAHNLTSLAEGPAVGIIGASNTITSKFKNSWVMNRQTKKREQVSSAYSWVTALSEICPELNSPKILFLESQSGYGPLSQRRVLLPDLISRFRNSSRAKELLLILSPSGNGISENGELTKLYGRWMTQYLNSIHSNYGSIVKKVVVLNIGARGANRGEEKAVREFNKRLARGDYPHIDQVIDINYALERAEGEAICHPRYCDRTSHWKRLGDYRVAMAIYSQLYKGIKLPQERLVTSQEAFFSYARSEVAKRNGASCFTSQF